MRLYEELLNKENMKNVWMLNHYAITPDSPGGTRHFELGKQLSKNGYNVVIFASNFIHMNFEFVKLKKNKRYKLEKFCNLDFIWVKTNSYKKNNWKRLMNMFSYCYRVIGLSRRLVKKGIIKKPDIIIGSTVHPFAALTAAFIARRYKIPFIFEIRDLWPQTFIDMRIWKKSSFVSRFFKFIEKKTVFKSNKIIVLSPKTKDYLLEKYDYLLKNIFYVPNGVYIQKEKNDQNSNVIEGTIVELSKIKNRGNFCVLFTGSLILTNKIENLISAAEKIKKRKNIKFILIGKGQHEAYYRKIITNKDLDNIQIFNPVRKNNIGKVLNMADVLVLNQGNVQWGSSNKVYDYLNSGKPIISSVFASHNDIVEKINAGVAVSPENPDALVHAIIKIYNMSEKERKIMGKKGLDYVKKNHDWKILGDKLDNLIINTLK